MPDPKKIRVRMAPGRTMPLPPGVGIDTNVQVLTPETTVEVLMSTPWVRRRLAAGDLVEAGAAESAPAGDLHTSAVRPLPGLPPEAEAVPEPTTENDTGRHRRGLFSRKKED